MQPSYRAAMSPSSSISASSTPPRSAEALQFGEAATSHISLAEVPARLTKERISRAWRLTDACMRSAGFPRPRIAVAGLNPHAGDGGNFGREEIEVIVPVVEAGKRDGICVEGPFPADTVFLRAMYGRRPRCKGKESDVFAKRS